MQAVVYKLFAKGGEYFYIGKRRVEDKDAWPDSWVGNCPDGYKGSGKKALDVEAKHCWDGGYLLARCDTEKEAYEIEEQKIAQVFGDHGCCNLKLGGQYFTSEDIKRFQSDPEVKKRIVTGLRAARSTPESRAKTSAASKATLSSVEARLELSERAKRTWKDPEVRLKRATNSAKAQRTAQARAARSVISKAALNNEATKNLISTKSKEAWKKPGAKVERGKLISAARSTPEQVQATSKASRERWTDSAYAQKVQDSLKAAWTGERKEAAKVASMKRYADVEYLAKKKAGIEAFWRNPIKVAQMREQQRQRKAEKNADTNIVE